MLLLHISADVTFIYHKRQTSEKRANFIGIQILFGVCCLPTNACLWCNWLINLPVVILLFFIKNNLLQNKVKRCLRYRLYNNCEYQVLTSAAIQSCNIIHYMCYMNPTTWQLSLSCLILLKEYDRDNIKVTERFCQPRCQLVQLIVCILNVLSGTFSKSRYYAWDNVPSHCKLHSNYNQIMSYLDILCIMCHTQSVTLGTSPMPLTSKNKFGLVKVPVRFNVY